MSLTNRKINKINKKLYNDWRIDSEYRLHKVYPLDSYTRMYANCTVYFQIKNKKKPSIILTIGKYYKTTDSKLINRGTATYIMDVRMGLLARIRLKRFRINTLITSSYYLSNERLRAIINN